MMNKKNAEDQVKLVSLQEGECPYCAEIIKVKAKICKHCGKEFGKEAVISSIPKYRCSLCQDKGFMGEPCTACGRTEPSVPL